MKTLIVFCLCVASALAGVQPWTREAEDNFLSLFKKYCSQSPDSGNDGDTTWHCKSSKDVRPPQTKQHAHRLELPSSNQKHLVFIETPADDYRHQISVTGELNNNQNTKIVVVPSADKHQYQVTDDVKVNSSGGKPSIFFLQTNPKGDGQSSQIQAATSGYNYGSPSASGSSSASTSAFGNKRQFSG